MFDQHDAKVCRAFDDGGEVLRQQAFIAIDDQALVFAEKVGLNLVQDTLAGIIGLGQGCELPGAIGAPEEVALRHVDVAGEISANNNIVVVFNPYEKKRYKFKLRHCW